MENRTTPAKMFARQRHRGAVQFAIAIYLFGGWNAFVSHPSLIILIVVTLAMLCIAPFSNVNLNSGEKEDRANRWVFLAFGVIALASAVIPPYTDRIGFLTIDGETTRWIGVAVYILRRRASPLSRLHARPAFQRTRRNPDRPQARNARNLRHHSQSQLSRHDRQHDRLGTRLSRLVRRRDRFPPADPARRPHPLRRTACSANISAPNTTPISRARGA